MAAVALLYLRELTGVRVPIPQLRRQVPDWWRTYFGRPVAAFLYGAGLGVGFFTYLGHGTLVAVTVAVAATGRPALGALAMAPFGLARGLAPLVGARVDDAAEGGRLVDRLGSMSGRVRRAATPRARGDRGRRRAGGRPAGEAAAAIVAVTFAWASIAKRHRLGTGGVGARASAVGAVERFAARAVPPWRPRSRSS